MSFRRTFNEQGGWRALVQENQALLGELPEGALVNQNAFRDYVTRGVHREVILTPSVFEISPKARADLFDFIHGRACFDMDATSFDHFNQACRSHHG